MDINSRATIWFNRIERFEVPICALFNRASNYKLVNVFFKAVSRLGDGVFWYGLILATIFTVGKAAILPALHILITAGFSVILYNNLKVHMVRERPFITHNMIQCNSRALDRYSFPSGHTWHAMSFSILFTFYYPALFWVVTPFALLVALSRFILGLHYITDVVVGGLIGLTIALLSMQLSYMFLI